jgi:hypothetical protein
VLGWAVEKNLQISSKRSCSISKSFWAVGFNQKYETNSRLISISKIHICWSHWIWIYEGKEPEKNQHFQTFRNPKLTYDVTVKMTFSPPPPLYVTFFRWPPPLENKRYFIGHSLRFPWKLGNFFFLNKKKNIWLNFKVSN